MSLSSALDRVIPTGQPVAVLALSGRPGTGSEVGDNELKRLPRRGYTGRGSAAPLTLDQAPLSILSDASTHALLQTRDAVQ